TMVLGWAPPNVTFERIAWTADGGALALLRSELDARGIPTPQAAWIVGRDGSGVRELPATGSAWARPLSWSPDGRWLALLLGPSEPCVSCRADGQQLAVTAADGSVTYQVGMLVRGGWLSWAPN